MGKLVDETGRKTVITISLIVQNSCVIICSVLLYLIIPFKAKKPPLDDFHFLGLFIAMNIVGSVAALASMVEDIAVGR